MEWPIAGEARGPLYRALKHAVLPPAAFKLELHILFCTSSLQILFRFIATAHQLCHLSSGNMLESWVWAKIHGAFSEHFGGQNYGRLFPLLPSISLLCLAFTPSCHLKNENSMFIIIHGNSLDTEKISLLPPPPQLFHFISFGKDSAMLCSGGDLLTAALPLDLQKDDDLHRLYQFLPVG